MWIFFDLWVNLLAKDIKCVKMCMIVIKFKDKVGNERIF